MGVDLEVVATRSRGGGDELQGDGDDKLQSKASNDDELQAIAWSRASNDDEFQATTTTSFRHNGGSVGQRLVLGFTSGTLSFLLDMGWA